jgi:hypothetical protein
VYAPPLPVWLNLAVLERIPNYEVIPLFINRAYREVVENENIDNNSPYALLVKNYLSLVAKLLIDFQLIDEHSRMLIPNALLTSSDLN